MTALRIYLAGRTYVRRAHHHLTCRTARASTALPSPLPFKSTGKEYVSLLRPSSILPRVSVVRSYPCGGVFVFVDATDLDGDSDPTSLSVSTLPSAPTAAAAESDVGAFVADAAARSSLALLALRSPLFSHSCLAFPLMPACLWVEVRLVPFRPGNGAVLFVGRARSLTDRSRDAVRRQGGSWSSYAWCRGGRSYKIVWSILGATTAIGRCWCRFRTGIWARGSRIAFLRRSQPRFSVSRGGPT